MRFIATVIITIIALLFLNKGVGFTKQQCGNLFVIIVMVSYFISSIFFESSEDIDARVKEEQRQQAETDRLKRVERDKEEQEDKEERAFQKQLDRERRRLEMQRGVDLRFSIEERLQNLKITEYNRQRILEMEQQLEGASNRKLNDLYQELNRLEER